MKGCLLLEYRCAQGCLLLRVWQTPNGRELVAPAHRRGRHELVRFLERAIARYFWDGTLREDDGGALVGRLDERWWVGMWLPLTCKHRRVETSMFAIAEDLAGATPGQPRRIMWPRLDM